MSLSVVGKGGNRSLAARLFDAGDSTGIGGRTIEFFAGGAAIGSATTNADGVATLKIPRANRDATTFEALFAGDDTYAGSSAQL
jgi:hypothetical protein